MICKIYTFRLNENEGCIIVENEEGEMIASSGCEEGIPTLCTEFCQAWIENPLPEVEIWEIDVMDISNAYTEEFGYLFTPKIENEEEHYDSEDEETFEEWLVGNGLEITLPKSDLEKLEDQWNSMNHLYEIVCEESEDEDDEPNAPTYQQYQACENQLYRMVDKLRNQLSSPPQEITTFTDMYGNVYDSLEVCEEGELRHKLLLEEQEEVRMAEFYNENPTGGEHSFQQMLAEEGLQRKDKGQFLDFINNEGEHFSQEIDKLMNKQVDDWQEQYENYKNSKKHILIKKKDLPQRVDFKMLVQSSSDIWNGGYILAETQDVNETVKTGQESCKNLELFFQLMKNPKFATKASFEIEKLLNK